MCIYNLEKAHDSTPPLHQATTINLRKSLESIHFRLFDEDNKSFVNFKEIKHLLNNTKQNTKLNSKNSTFESK